MAEGLDTGLADAPLSRCFLLLPTRTGLLLPLGGGWKLCQRLLYPLESCGGGGVGGGKHPSHQRHSKAEKPSKWALVLSCCGFAVASCCWFLGVRNMCVCENLGTRGGVVCDGKCLFWFWRAWFGKLKNFTSCSATASWLCLLFGLD